MASDTFILVLTDSLSCQIEDTIILSDNGAISDNDSINHISCFGFSDGWIKVSPSGGLGPYSLNWDTLGSSDSIGGLPPGVYQLEITDSLGCSDSFIYSIAEPSLLTDSVDSTNVLCIGDSTGSIVLIVNGGVLPYQYLWSNGDSVNQT